MIKSIEISKIRNNSIVIFASQIISLALNLISISLAARYLGVEDFGKFNYLLAIVGISAKFLDFGFNPIIFRELSKSNTHDDYVGTVFVFRTVSVIAIIILFIVFGLIFDLGFTEILLISILALNVLFSNKFTNLRELLSIPFKVELKMHIPMLFVVLDNALLLILVLFMPLFNGGLFYFVIVYSISNLPGVILLFISVYTKYDFKFKMNFNQIKYLFKESLPLMGFVIISFIYSQIDILFLKNLSGATSVGIYSSALRLIIPLKIIPNVVVITLFSIIVRNINDDDNNQRIVKFVSKLFFLFGIVFSTFMFLGAREVISIVFGKQYYEAAVPLKILSLGLFFDFFNFFILDLFTAYNKQKYNFLFVVLVAIVVTALNILLIPIFDFVGSSIARVISSIIGFLFLLIILKHEIKINVNFLNYRLIIFIFFFLVGVYFLSGFPLIFNILISSLLFGLLLIFIKVFSLSEMEIILNFISNKKITAIISKIYKIAV